jgi:hypothetical protein
VSASLPSLSYSWLYCSCLRITVVHRPRPHDPRPGHLQSEAALGWARETHGLVEAPSQAPHVVGRRTSLQKTSTLLRARPHTRAPADRLQHRQGGRAAQRLAELGGCRSRQREMAQARSSATGTAGACRAVPVETKPISEQARTERTQSEHAQSALDPAATTWSQRLRSRG